MKKKKEYNFIIFLIRYTFTVDANEIIRAYVVIFSRFAAFPLIAYAAIDTAIIAVSIISAAVKINRNIYAGKLELIIFLMYSPVFFTFLPPCIFLRLQSKSSDHKFIFSLLLLCSICLCSAVSEQIKAQ